VSQSNNLMANMALEEWLRRSDSYKNKNLLLLSSNVVKTGRNIKAFFHREPGHPSPATERELIQQANLVLNCLPKNAMLVQLPEVRVEDEEGSVLISVPLENPEETAVQSTLQDIADYVVENGSDTSRVSLVRPDKGWFPGIQDIQEDMEVSLKEILAIKSDKRKHVRPGPSRDQPPRQNSYGNYF